MLGYTYQEILVLIGSKSGTTRTSVVLESTYQTESGATKPIRSFATGGMSKIDFGILYTTGAGETDNSIEVKIESSFDGTNYYRIPNETVLAGVSTLTQREFTFVGAVAATAYSLSLPIDIWNKYMRISIKETGVAANKGTIYVEGTISGAK